ncbi:MAG TPA: hypothetical protein VJX66_09540 [Amycolatopsis sp.]|nr:hypothetical protein [Amycolatopsis sp.]
MTEPSGASTGTSAEHDEFVVGIEGEILRACHGDRYAGQLGSAAEYGGERQVGRVAATWTASQAGSLTSKTS